MKDGLRHGLGLEIAIQSDLYREKCRVTSFKRGRRLTVKKERNKEMELRKKFLSKLVIDFVKDKKEELVKTEKY